MKLYGAVLLASIAMGSARGAEELTMRARELERKGDPQAARAMLDQASRQGDVPALSAYAEFLDVHNDPGARAAYRRLLEALPPGSSEQRAKVARRLVVLDMLAGDRDSAVKHAADYRNAAGGELKLPDPPQSNPGESQSYITIPGPLRSFARMAALSPDMPSEELLGALARNVVTNGYQASSSNEALDQTEYLKLVIRYLSQARELEKLAGEQKVIVIKACESPETAELLRVLGFRMRGGCGSEVVLETVNASRAFLTIDSGFPIAELEQALRTNRPFEYDFRPTQVPVMYGADYWMSIREKPTQEFIDLFLSDPSVCRLYLGLSKLDRTTGEQMRKAVPIQRLRAFAHVLDFFGGMLQIRDGKAVVPGGARAAKAWEELVGSPPDQGVQFFEKLIARDDGWLASYYDALARVNGPAGDYLTEPGRLKRFYAALRGRVTSPGPARPVFRSNTDLMLLSTRLRITPDGKPHIPGGIEVWKNLFIKHPHGKYDGKLTRLATTWKEPDDVVEALFALCRKAVENEPLKIFMALSDIDRRRAQPLQPATVDRLAREYRQFGAQYPILNETPQVSDSTIVLFIDTAEAVTAVRDQGVRANSAGTLQGLVGLWQILVRQEAIPSQDADAALRALLEPFAKIRNDRELFDAGQTGVKRLLSAAGAKPDVSPQDAMIDLLAGTATSPDTESHTRLVQDMIRIFEAQRLVSLKSIFDLTEHLDAVAKGAKPDTALLARLASRIGEIHLPRSAMTSVEKNSFAFGYWTERHIENQRKLNLRSAVEKAAGDPEKIRDLRGQLAPILRDTLVGLNYVHYAPPGAQILLTNPLFVRSHDFLGLQGANQTWRQTEVFGTGWPSSAGGRLVGSLAGLPYALAEAEQNFLIPSREQALIWGDLVPQMILSAKVPRWWKVTPSQLHWVALHMRYAESAIAEAALDDKARARLLAALEKQAPPARVYRVSQALERGDVKAALESITPSESYVVAVDLLASQGENGPLAAEIRRMAQESPSEISHQAVSRAFGTPKPTLANSYNPELLNLRTFPTLMGYSSRIMAESWESSLLYFAALADEMHVPPAQLNVLVPEWTQMTVQRIFATHLEDWPALLRSLRLVGEDLRKAHRQSEVVQQKASLEE